MQGGAHKHIDAKGHCNLYTPPKKRLIGYLQLFILVFNFFSQVFMIVMVITRLRSGSKTSSALRLPSFRMVSSSPILSSTTYSAVFRRAPSLPLQWPWLLRLLFCYCPHRCPASSSHLKTNFFLLESGAQHFCNCHSSQHNW